MEKIISKIKNSYKVRKVLSVCSRFVSDFYEKIVNEHPKLKPINVKDGWSVVIITNGKANDFLKQTVRSIKNELTGTPFEIIVVGPPQLKKIDFGADVTLIPYRELNISPGWITKKKNIGVAHTIYDKVVISHDYLTFEPGWKKGFDEFGSDFDVCMNKVLSKDGTRYVDWITCDFPRVGHGSLPYETEITKYQYLSGTYFITKRNFFAKNPLDEKYRWGEAEDVYWSYKIRKITVFKMNTKSSVRLLKQKTLPSLPKQTWEDNTEKIKIALQSTYNLSLRNK